ncbi:membrane-bound PQQ-dependent dehydrogenase, glucose/quinate/shikimate family [Gluconobacter sp. P1C6_b]|uniref:membrane-bound PQQ-dependent dehydrogenase, glucose/quinate/shikimate family n=1 Tax=Gluconobacter sp. P1C6_b TaxID=2762619 RepID=UPI001C0516E6|nr:membrane-bound PQQ-dependent dehydrogenase, glucose/quinate/shikimate family [Gluconobacter sp. P1C6_b]
MHSIDQPSSRPALLLAWLLAIALFVTGLYFFSGGIWLLVLGGSPYFALESILLLTSAWFLMRRQSLAFLLFMIFYITTVLWAFGETGIDFWPLISRLFVPSVFLLVFFALLPYLRQISGKTPLRGPSYGLCFLTCIGLIGAFAEMFIPHAPVAGPTQEAPLASTRDGTGDWSAYGRTAAGTRFAPFSEINRDTISRLHQAWTIHTGDIPISPGGNGAEDQETPLQIGNTLFLCTPHNNVIAVDADSGSKRWEAHVNSQSKIWQRCRGLGYFDASASLPVTTNALSAPAPISHDPTAPCDKRLFTNTPDGRLIAIDAQTGEYCQEFGTHGTVNLLEGLGTAPDPQYQVTSPPTIAGTTVIVGGRIADNVKTDMPGGVIRGYDVISGTLRWAFDARNPDPNHKLAEGETYRRSSANSWAPMSYDAAMNTVFIPMGSSSVDLWGANRTPEDHKYATSILALDATTGRIRWVYQTVHNDLWDFDIPMQPTLIDVPTAHGTSPAVVFGTKSGQIFVLDRATGQPLTDVKEVPVPKADIPNEHYSPTQPVSVGMPQIGAGPLSEADMWGATPFDQLACRISFRSMRYTGLFTAPGTDTSLSFPGSLGGMNWGGISTDPDHHYIFVNDMRLGLWVRMVKTSAPAPTPSAGQSEKVETGKTGSASGGEAINAGMGAVPLGGTPYSVVKNRFMSPLQIPCQKPPFGTLSAIDMRTHKIVWQVPVGTVQDTGPFGIKMHAKMPIGMPTLGGTLATKGGLVFIAGTQDYYLRAFDSATGKEVWKARLPVGSQGGPMSYVSPSTHRQYIVISVGGARQSPDRGDDVIAFALDKQ